METYITVDQQIHQLSQIIAKINRTFVTKEADDSHTNFYFDEIGGRIFGRWIDTKEGKIIFTLNLTSFHFHWLNDDFVKLHSFEISNKKSNEIESAIENSLSDLGLSPRGFRNSMHYAIPEYEFANTAFQNIPHPSLQEWMKYRSIANQACYDLMGHLQAKGEVRIWPHHFDTGIYIKANSKTGIGFGLAMKDAMVGSPYFYNAVYSLNNKKISYENIPALNHGKWIVSDNWSGAVLPLQDLGETKYDKLKSFMAQTTRWFLTHNE